MTDEQSGPCCHCGGPGKWIMIALLAVFVLSFAYMAVKPSAANQITIGNLTSSYPSEKTIQVSADAKKSVAPDLLTLTFTVESLNNTAKDSQADNARRMEPIIASLKSNGISQEDIETSSYSIYPEYKTDWICSDGSLKCDDAIRVYNTTLVGYRTVNSVSVTINDVSQGGKFVDLMGSSGADRVDSVYFSLKDATRKDLELVLLEEASDSAKQRAQKIASGLGAEIGDAVSASTSYYYYPVYANVPNYKGAADSASGASETSISPGKMDISVSISASFEMK